MVIVIQLPFVSEHQHKNWCSIVHTSMFYFHIQLCKLEYSCTQRANLHLGMVLVRICKSHKKVFRMKTSACRDGTLKNQPNKMGTTPQHIYTIPTSCAICQLCSVLVSRVNRRVVEAVERVLLGA